MAYNDKQSVKSLLIVLKIIIKKANASYDVIRK